MNEEQGEKAWELTQDMVSGLGFDVSLVKRILIQEGELLIQYWESREFRRRGLLSETVYKFSGAV